MTEHAENVQTLFEPNTAAMREHLEHLFGGYLDGNQDGLIELAWTDAQPNAEGRYPLRHASMFGTDQIDSLIAKASTLNRQHNCNVYVGAALRKPGTFPGGRASAADVLALTCAYADLDDKDVASVARQRWGNATPTKIVVTGTEPHLRAQLWWRLDEPITDQQQSEILLKGIATTMHGDSTVTDAPRVMRLAGSIAWPMKPDRKRPELTRISRIKEVGQPIYSLQHLVRTFPPIGGGETGDIKFTTDDGVKRGADVFGLQAKVEDGRERYMMKTANAVLIELIGITGKAPTAQELFDAAWPQYERSTDLTRSGRGQKEFAAKCIYTVKRFLDGKIKGCETIEVVQALYRQRQQARGQDHGSAHQAHDYSADFDQAQAQASAKTDLFEYLTIEQILSLPPPKWLIEKLIIEQAVGFIFGPPGSLKTFVALDIAMSIATQRANWWDYNVARHGTVIYILNEGVLSVPHRLKVWEQHRQTAIANTSFRLIRQSINFMRVEDVGKLLATVQAIIDETGPVVAVFVDTVSRVLPGAKENQQEDMSLFIAACDAVKDRFGATVIGVHHTNYAGGFRGSTVMPAAGAFLIETRREPGAMSGSIYALKVKDGEDGWERFFTVSKITLADAGQTTSLMVDGVSQEPLKKESDAWPDRDTLRKILAAIDGQWHKQQPWCFSKNTPRNAVNNIMLRWRLKRKIVEDILAEWNANDIIAEEICDAQNHVKGYRKLVDL